MIMYPKVMHICKGDIDDALMLDFRIMQLESFMGLHSCDSVGNVRNKFVNLYCTCYQLMYVPDAINIMI